MILDGVYPNRLHHVKPDAAAVFFESHYAKYGPEALNVAPSLPLTELMFATEEKATPPEISRKP